MKITFPIQDNANIIQSIKAAMDGRSLNEIVQLEDHGDEIHVIISKLGKSTLVFKRHDAGGKTKLSLASEKIAFAHKAFQSDVKAKFVDVVKKAGGSIVS